MKTRSRFRYSILGAIAFALFGLGLLVVGGRLIAYQQLLGEDARRVTGEIVESGSVRRTGGGSVDYIRYRFEDAAGGVHRGQSSGYSGEVGDTILVEYAPAFPFVHRVAGEGRKPGYRWRWAIAGAGLLFAVAGLHWGLHTWGRLRLGHRLAREGVRIEGTVCRLGNDGRTIDYEYTTPAGSFRGRSTALARDLARQYAEGDAVTVLHDRARHARSVLEIELER